MEYQESEENRIDPGALSPWQIQDLPAPPPFSLKNSFRIVGPGAILLAASIGGGEWLVGPAAGVKFGVQIMWIATVSILLQVVFNLEAIRYTLYTGEPIYGGILRLRPGSKLWAPFYCLLTFLSLGWPALAGASAAVLFSSFAGRLPQEGDSASVYWIALVVILGIALILSLGGTIERSLERFSWVMILFMFSFLLLVNLIFVPASVWVKTLTGFFSFHQIQSDIDWSLLGALAAASGAGGIANLSITNWIRDKGFGMGKLVGAIPSAIGGVRIQLSHVGIVFPINSANLSRWKDWLRYVHLDQIWIWGFLAFWGMFLNVNLAAATIPEGTDITGLAAGAYQARYLADHVWTGFWMVTLWSGFWTVFSTQLGNTDLFVRTITDVLWLSSRKFRSRRTLNVRKIYYSLLLAFVLWAVFAIALAVPFALFKIMANVSGFILAVGSIHILLVNRRFLPRELRPPRWRQAALGLCCIFYGFFFLHWLRQVILG